MWISTGRMEILRFGRRLARDERGATLVYVSLALTVFMGFAALVIDGSRLYTLDTEMQSAADALALAGAAELDGNSDAITRATAAMDNLVANYETFGDSGTPITGYAARFLDSLPASDAEEITEDYATDVPEEVRFVEVRLLQEEGEGDADGEDNTRSISTMFAIAIGGGDTASAGAVAVAGFTSAVCKFTPLFMCNPYEGSGTDIIDALNDPTQQRRLITLRKGPGGGESAYAPGNFGFLQPDGGNGAAAIKQSLGKVDPGACFEKDGVELHTGAIQSVHQAVNTRFDIYAGGGINSNNPDYRPAMNVTKGYLKKNPSRCSQESYTGTAVPPPAMGFPRDDCSTGGCQSLGGEPNRIGNGDWDFGKYWDVNHGNRNGALDETYPNGWTDADPPSRYDVYRWEVDPDNDPDTSANNIPDNTTAGGEDGNPECSPVTPTDDPDRRILYAAVINCTEHAADMVGASGPPIPAEAFVRMFIIAPMTKVTGPTDEDRDLLVEMTGVVKPGIDSAVLHDIVQLYR